MKTTSTLKGQTRLYAGVASAVICMAFGTPAAYAQDAQAADDEADSGEIIVTGSRIPQPNLEGISPVTTVNSQEIKITGTTRVENLINALPQAFAEYGSNDSNGALGIATANLRGLGSNRTLVLVNGRRLVPGDPTSVLGASPDLNNIPAALVKRVDVLTGGASSVYGADAVGGVVNFVMDTDFSGFKVDSQYSFYQHSNSTNQKGIIKALNGRKFGYPTGSTTDGGTIDSTATIGAGFDDNRGHIVAYVGYRKANPITQDKRDYSACTLQATAAGSTVCGGSATSGQGSFIMYDDGTSTFFQVGAGRNFVPGLTRFNFAPTNYYQRPDERYTAGFFAKYEVSDSFKPYLEGMFMDDRSVAQIAPSGDFGNTLSINCDNPLLSAQQLSIVCDAENLLDANGNAAAAGGGAPNVYVDPTTGTTYNKGFMQLLRRNVEGGPRRNDLQHTSYRIVAGANGDIAKGLSYDAFYQYGRTNYNQTYYNDFSITRIARALDVVKDPRAGSATAGQPICRSVLDGSDTNCVPWDVFAPGGVTQAAVNYLATPGFQRGQTSEQVLGANISALLGEYGVTMPWTDKGVGLNFGFEYRKESLELNTDTLFQTGDLAGQGAPSLPVAGTFNVKEFYAETRIPIVNDGFIKELALEAGYRYSNYHVSGNSISTDTYKVGLDFAPIDDVRFRVAYNRAVRAPNIQELFAPQIVALDGNADPCAGNSPSATLAQCKNDPYFAANPGQYGKIAGNPAGQYNGFTGGNPNLTPEVADTYTVGVVIQPNFVPRLAITVDYFNIKVKNTVSTIGADTILNTCYTEGKKEFCDLIKRDQFGSIWRTNQGFVIDTQQNLGSLKTSGIDMGVSYSKEIGQAGTLAFNVNGTYLKNLTTDDGVSTPYDCKGYFGLQCGTPNPKWRHRARLSFTMPNGIGLSTTWRYFDPVKLDRSSSNPTLKGAFSPVNAKIKAQSYFDLALSAAVADKFTFRLGVNNILDKEPPIIGSNGTSAVINACPSVFCNGNTFPNVYDALGRYVFAGVTLEF